MSIRDIPDEILFAESNRRSTIKYIKEQIVHYQNQIDKLKIDMKPYEEELHKLLFDDKRHKQIGE